MRIPLKRHWRIVSRFDHNAVTRSRNSAANHTVKVETIYCIQDNSLRAARRFHYSNSCFFFFFLLMPEINDRNHEPFSVNVSLRTFTSKKISFLRSICKISYYHHNSLFKYKCQILANVHILILQFAENDQSSIDHSNPLSGVRMIYTWLLGGCGKI